VGCADVTVFHSLHILAAAYSLLDITPGYNRVEVKRHMTSPVITSPKYTGHLVMEGIWENCSPARQS